ncbi:MAG: stage V sporulation protein AC [Eubacteriales bacterium]
MDMDKKTYKKFAEAHAPRSPIGKNCFNAFCIGGLICAMGQGFNDIYRLVFGFSEDDAGMLASCTLVLISVTLTAFGVFDEIAKFAGAGTLVPITGFANAVVSPAIDSKCEGFILGVGAKIFTVAGPVLLYGILSGAIYGVIYYFVSML